MLHLAIYNICFRLYFQLVNLRILSVTLAFWQKFTVQLILLALIKDLCLLLWYILMFGALLQLLLLLASVGLLFLWMIAPHDVVVPDEK